MIEAIKHLFGFCGDEHSSIFGIGLVPGVLFFGGGFYFIYKNSFTTLLTKSPS